MVWVWRAGEDIRWNKECFIIDSEGFWILFWELLPKKLEGNRWLN